MPHTPSVPDFTKWPSFPFEGEFRVKDLDPPVAVEPARKGEGTAECISCNAPDDAYIWISERWRVRAMDRPTGLPMVLILESRSHLDLGDLPNLLAAELGVMTVRLERAIRSLDGVARVHVNRWGDGSAHLHMWFLARPYGRLQLRGTFLSLWDDILPSIPESQWRENLAYVAAWLAEFGGRPLAEPPRIQWQAPSNLLQQASAAASAAEAVAAAEASAAEAAAAAEAQAAADASAALAGAPQEESDAAQAEPGAAQAESDVTHAEPRAAKSESNPAEAPAEAEGTEESEETAESAAVPAALAAVRDRSGAASEGDEAAASPAAAETKNSAPAPGVERQDQVGSSDRGEASTDTTSGTGSGIAATDTATDSVTAPGSDGASAATADTAAVGTTVPGPGNLNTGDAPAADRTRS